MNIMDIGVSAKITLMNLKITPWTSGIPLQPKDQITLVKVDGKLRGIKVQPWPEEVPQNHPLPERLIFVISDRPINMAALDSGKSVGKRELGTASPLASLLQQINQAGRRTLKQNNEVRYAVEQISFLLNPLE